MTVGVIKFAAPTRFIPMKFLFVIFTACLITSCAQPFPRPGGSCCLDGIDGNEIFQKTFVRHGGQNLKQLKSVSYDLKGNWKNLITKIQPLVTDSGFRIRSKEIIFLQDGTYYADYYGPEGNKWVLHNSGLTEVYYNGERSFDIDVLASTALTAESFYIFALGPLALSHLNGRFVRLKDIVENGKSYFRIYSKMIPGIGKSELDEVVVWVDSDTWLTWRVHFTLEGYATTKGAHVDVTFEEYHHLADYIFPSAFFERVRGPIAIDAHEWQTDNYQLNSAPLPVDLRRPTPQSFR